eukprot:6204347-Pleurochrysis_carterae.AAC.2
MQSAREPWGVVALICVGCSYQPGRAGCASVFTRKQGTRCVLYCSEHQERMGLQAPYYKLQTDVAKQLD